MQRLLLRGMLITCCCLLSTMTVYIHLVCFYLNTRTVTTTQTIKIIRAGAEAGEMEGGMSGDVSQEECKLIGKAFRKEA